MGWADDLQRAASTGVIVEITLRDGEHWMSGVHEVDEASGVAVVDQPGHFAESRATRRIDLAEIQTLTVTGIPWSPNA